MAGMPERLALGFQQQAECDKGRLRQVQHGWNRLTERLALGAAMQCMLTLPAPSSSSSWMRSPSASLEADDCLMLLRTAAILEPAQQRRDHGERQSTVAQR